jgi:hypothetical protein
MKGGKSALSADFDFAAAAAFRAVAAPAAGTARAFATVAAGEACSRGASASVARGASSIAWGIAIDANVGRHGTPPCNWGDSARLSSRCQIEQTNAVLLDRMLGPKWHSDSSLCDLVARARGTAAATIAKSTQRALRRAQGKESLCHYFATSRFSASCTAS